MTTIKLKNGSGAPTAGDLAQGEPALDLTNKRLYTEDSGGTVIEVGTNPTSVTTGDITATGTATFAGLTTTANVSFGDNDKAIFGAGSDLQIYHDGSASYIKDLGTGPLAINTNGSEIMLTGQSGSEYMVRAIQDGAVELYYDASKKLATTSTGIDVTGVITTDGMTTSADINFGDNDKAIFGASSDLQIYHDGSNSFIRDAGTGNLVIRGTSLNLQKDGGESYITMVADGAVTAYYDNSAKLATTSTGIDVTGTVVSDGLTVDGTVDVNLGSDGSNIASFSGASAGRKLDIQSFAVGASAGAGYSINATSGQGQLDFQTAGNSRLNIDAGGDISFYEDTGTTAKLFWDASAESLGIGTSSPTSYPVAPNLVVDAGTNGGITVKSGTSNYGGLYFADGTTGNEQYRGFVQYNHNYAGSTDELLFGTSGSEAMRIDSSGNVGIGSTNPAGWRLRIEKADAQHLLLLNTTGNGTRINMADQTWQGEIEQSAGSLLFKTGGTTERMRIDSSGLIQAVSSITSDPTNTNAYFYNKSGVGPTLSGYRFSIRTGATPDESLRVDESGNLLVGATSTTPWSNGTNTSSDNGIAAREDGILGVSAYKSTANSGNVAIFNRTGTDGPIQSFYKSGATVGSIGVDNSDNLYITGNSSHAGLMCGSTEILPYKGTTLNDGANDLGASSFRWKDLYLSNAVYAGDTGLSAGDLFVAIDGDANGITTGYKLRTGVASTSSASHLAFVNPNGIVGTIKTSGSATSFNTSSDHRLKENVVAMSGATERLKQLAPKRFNFIADADVTVDGFLAHEVQSVVPEAITGTHNEVDDDGNPIYQGIDQSKLVPLLVATIQELEARIAALESN